MSHESYSAPVTKRVEDRSRDGDLGWSAQLNRSVQRAEGAVWFSVAVSGRVESWMARVWETDAERASLLVIRCDHLASRVPEFRLPG